jgi:hypothetical protein
MVGFGIETHECGPRRMMTKQTIDRGIALADHHSIPNIAISILKFIWRLLRPARAFVARMLIRATPMLMPRGICCATDFIHIPLREAGTTFFSTPRIVGGPPMPEESVVIRSKFAAPKRTAEMFVLCVEGGHSTRHGMNLSADRRLISDVSYENSWPVNNRSSKGISRWPSFSSFQFPARTRHIKSTVVTVTSVFQWNYFHWLFDVLPRVHVAKMAGVGTAKYYVECNHKFQKESLDLLGIHPEAVIDAIQNPIIQAATLFIPSYPEATTGIPPWACEFLKSTLLVESQKRASRVDRPKGRKIYISRLDSKRGRRLTNEKELIDLLEGFEVLELGSMSMAEQIRTFANADVIIAPHGAGLANIVFCQKGTTVIEISAPKYIIGMFHDLAANCGLEYYLVFGRGVDLSYDPGWTHQDDDYSVDLALVQRAVEMAIRERRV